MTRKCLACGVTFEGKSGQTLCASCAAASRAGSVVRQRICRECGAAFDGGPRAWYCPRCRADRRREQRAAARKRKAAGHTRKLGSRDICTVCGGEYTVSGSNQRYCPACAPAAVRAIDRQQTRQWAADNVDYQQRKQQRKDSTAERKCVICGAMFTPKNKAVTCSADCSAALAKLNTAAAEKRNRAERNARRRALYAAKKASMTPEEFAEYREQVNRKWMENYRKRTEKLQKTGEKNND